MNSQSRQADSFEKAAVLMLLSKGIIKALGIVSTLILVRLISPEDFGLVSVSMAIYGFIEIFGLFGFHNALVHKGNPSKNDYDVVFTFSALFGTAACILLVLSSSFIATYFQDDRIAVTLKWIALMFFFNGLKNIKTIAFQIDMNFSKELRFQIAPKFISFFSTIALAFYLQNYNALIYGMLINAVVTLCISYSMIPYMPRLTLNGAGSLWRYSKWLMLNSFLQYLNNKAVDLIIGKFISLRAVGLYSISSEISNLPATDICAPINKASFAAFSKAKDTIDAVRDIYEKNNALTNTITLPISIGILVTSSFLVPVVLGEQWLEAIQLMKIISVSCIVAVLGANASYILMSLGTPKTVFNIAALRTVIFFGFTMTMLTPLGIYAVVWASLLSTTVSSALFIFCLYKVTGIGLSSLLLPIWRPITASTAMSIIVLAFQSVGFSISIAVDFAAQVTIGVFVYVSMLFFLWKLVGYPDGIERNIVSKIINLINITR